ncbi:MAG: response regulator transcription factor [Bacteroidetes bacterium]|nr:response regulator transcription factor [Bacteroidota bacterium]
MKKKLSDSVSQYLTNSGISCEQVYTYQAAVQKIEESSFDGVIIDIGLPDGSGIDLISHIKQKKYDASLIIISARNSIEDKVEGLTTGADDFLVKPFHLSELNARVNAIVRRKKFNNKEVLDFNELSVHIQARTVFVNEKKVYLTKKEFDLLVYFISNQGKTITKEAIAFSLWRNNADLAASGDIIYTHIKNMRKKLVDGGCKDYVNAIYGIGYKFGA